MYEYDNFHSIVDYWQILSLLWFYSSILDQWFGEMVKKIMLSNSILGACLAWLDNGTPTTTLQLSGIGQRYTMKFKVVENSNSPGKCLGSKVLTCCSILQFQAITWGLLFLTLSTTSLQGFFSQIGIDIQLEESKESKVAQDRNLNVHLVMKAFGETSH